MFCSTNTLLKICILTTALVTSLEARAQLDSIHWLPPITSENISSNAGAHQHSIYLSTPETTAFDVTVTTGTGTPVGTYSISNSTPYRLDLSNGNNYLCMELDSVGSVQRDDGLIFTADFNFYVNYRIRSGAQGGSLTAKGRIARGNDFYWGGVPMIGNNAAVNAVAGIMAIEDNTNITIDGYDSNCAFRLGGNSGGITSNSLSIQLNAGETFVLEAVNLVTPENADGWIGSHIIADKDIVVNNGNLMGAVISGSGARDICLDQTLPVTRLGMEYITLRGNGIDATELVIVVATKDGTSVSLNGTAPSTSLNEGQYQLFDGTHYSAQNNMHIETSAPAYIYQVLAGSSNERTIGLNFIPPLNCLLPLSLNNIPQIDMIRSASYTGGVSILTRTGATVMINGAPPTSSPQTVDGSSLWVTYLETGLSGDVAISSTEPMAAGMFGASGDAGFAGYFSGFSERPQLEIETNSACVPATLSLINTADNIQWYFDNNSSPGATNQTNAINDEGLYFLTASKGSCVDTSNTLVFSCNSLPVEISSFDFYCEENRPVLQWITNTEKDNAYFTIEGSIDGETFHFIHEEEGQENSLSKQTYTYALSSNELLPYYRLKQTDINGASEVFESISSRECGSNSRWYYSDGTFTLSGTTCTEVSVYNLNGIQLYKSSSSQLNSFQFSPPRSGIYYIQYQTTSGIWNTSRIPVFK